MEKNMEINCWEFKGCPEERQKTCPAHINQDGRKCWLVTGTMCGGVQQGTIRDKLAKCHECDFFKMRGGVPQ